MIKKARNKLIEDKERFEKWRARRSKESYKLTVEMFAAYKHAEELREKQKEAVLRELNEKRAEGKNRKERAGVINIVGKPKTTKKLADENNIDYREIKQRQDGIVMNDDNSETRRFVEMCYRTTSTMINPIVDWTDEDVWEFLHYYGCQANPLYQCGQKRIGCIGCPLQGFKGMKRDFALYPKYRENYVRAFDRMLKKREEDGMTNTAAWSDGEHVMRWWVGEDPNQITLSDLGIDI